MSYNRGIGWLRCMLVSYFSFLNEGTPLLLVIIEELDGSGAHVSKRKGRIYLTVIDIADLYGCLTVNMLLQSIHIMLIVGIDTWHRGFQSERPSLIFLT